MSGSPAPTCKRCGKCCLINVNAFITDDDLKRWRREGRTDILHILENEKAVWAGDHMVSARDGTRITCCPFLEHTGDHYTCTIYDTRPFVCRHFAPGSSDLCPQYDPVTHPMVEQHHHREH